MFPLWLRLVLRAIRHIIDLLLQNGSDQAAAKAVEEEKARNLNRKV